MENLSKYGKRKFIGTMNPIIIAAIIIIVILPSCKIKLKDKSDDELWKIAFKICENNLISFDFKP